MQTKIKEWNKISALFKVIKLLVVSDTCHYKYEILCENHIIKVIIILIAMFNLELLVNYGIMQNYSKN